MNNVARFKNDVAQPTLVKPQRRLQSPSVSHLMNLAAMLLFIVSAMTAFYGASVVRPDQKPFAMLTAAGSVLALAAIEKRLLANIVVPTASSLRLLLCAAPFLALCAFFSAATFFEVHRREIDVQADREEVWARWQQETPRFIAFQTAAIALLKAARTQEEAELMLPAVEGTSPAASAASRRKHRTRIAMVMQAEKLATNMPAMPLTPADAKAADASLATAYKWAQRVALAAPSDVTPRLTVPTPGIRTPRADDVVSILIRETGTRSTTAKFAWGGAVFVGCLPFLCLLANIPGVACATRLRRARARFASIGSALTAPLDYMNVPFRVTDLGVTGTVKLHGDLGHLRVNDFLASLDTLYSNFEQKAGREVRAVAIVDDQGKPLDSSTLLTHALASGPLLLELQ